MISMPTKESKRQFCNYCQIGDCKNCLGLNYSIRCNHDCNYFKKQKLGYKDSELLL